MRMAMIAAGFTGGEAEELRRAFGFKRSEKRMKRHRGKIASRHGAQRYYRRRRRRRLLQSITSFALYGFPESHAASFALIAYASAWLKCHYLAAFTAALLNNQPMGFYSPATIVKDAQRHGLKVKAIDVTISDWMCTLEPVSHASFAMRMGLRYARGLREESARAILRERNRSPFTSIANLSYRVPELRRDEMALLASIGALNSIGGMSSTKDDLDRQSPPRTQPKLHRRDALWQVERAARFAGPLLDGISESDTASPLSQMTAEERLIADFHGTGLTVGPHPLAYLRDALQRARIVSAKDLTGLPDGKRVRTAGCVIARQRPGTAKGFVFLSLEDETGISNAIITPDLLDQNRILILSEKFLLLEGVLQNQEGVVSIKVARVRPLREAYTAEQIDITNAAVRSHDFH